MRSRDHGRLFELRHRGRCQQGGRQACAVDYARVGGLNGISPHLRPQDIPIAPPTDATVDMFAASLTISAGRLPQARDFQLVTDVDGCASRNSSISCFLIVSFMFMRVNARCAHQWSDVEPTVGQPPWRLLEKLRASPVARPVGSERGWPSLDVHRCGRFGARPRIDPSGEMNTRSTDDMSEPFYAESVSSQAEHRTSSQSASSGRWNGIAGSHSV